MSKFTKSFIVLMFIFSFSFVGVDKVDAYNDKLCPSDTQAIEGQAISCDYDFFDGNAKGTLVFTNSSNYGYCATVVSQNLESWGLGRLIDEVWNATAGHFLPSFNISKELRSLVSFDVSESLIKDAVNNKQCPKIKMVRGYDVLTDETEAVVYSDQTGISGCALSFHVSFGSQCAINDGYNMQELTAEDVSDTVNDQQGGLCDEACISAIKNWAKQEDYLDVSNIGDPCNIISNSLKDILNNVFFLISVVGIVLVVVMTALSFIKALTASDDEKLKDAFKHLTTRIIVVIILLLLPVLLSFVINLVNDTVGTGEVSIGSDGDVFCKITD